MPAATGQGGGRARCPWVVILTRDAHSQHRGAAAPCAAIGATPGDVAVKTPPAPFTRANRDGGAWERLGWLPAPKSGSQRRSQKPKRRKNDWGIYALGSWLPVTRGETRKTEFTNLCHPVGTLQYSRFTHTLRVCKYFRAAV